MRVATFSFLLASLLFGAGAIGALGTWAVTTSCLVMLIGAVVGAVAMEERDLGSVAGLAAVADDDVTEPLPAGMGLTDAA
jgi:hypothetical protein